MPSTLNARDMMVTLNDNDEISIMIISLSFSDALFSYKKNVPTFNWNSFVQTKIIFYRKKKRIKRKKG